MKIGIVTFYAVPNYGAILQANALCTILKEQGHFVYFLPFKFAKASWYNGKNLFLSRSLASLRRKIQHNFDLRSLIASLPFSLPELDRASFQNLLDTGSGLDACIVGSDQMWNPAWFHDALDSIFLQFVNPPSNRIAYAVSIGADSWPDEMSSYAQKALPEFNHISVRENASVSFLQGSFKVNSTWVLDPTLLLTRQFYDELLRRSFVSPDGVSEKYVFTYMLSWKTANISEIVASVIEQTGAICAVSHQKKKVFGFSQKKSIPEWLLSIRNAEFVVTNSFHGTVFSILFQRPFLCVALSCDKNTLESGMNVRIVSLLTRLELLDRLVFDETKVELNKLKKIDWARVESLLSEWRQESLSFLFDALNG